MLLRQITNLLLLKKHPATLVHFITERCNARCPFCFVDFSTPPGCPEELSLQEIALITEKLPRTLMNVNITGGEPFVRSDIVEIADLYFTNSSAQSLFITTNGFFTSRIVHFCETIRNKHPEKTLFFSLSINQIGAKQDALTSVEGMFERSVATLAALKAFAPDIKTSVAITISPQNRRDAVALYDYLVNEKQIGTIQLVVARSAGVYSVPPDEQREMSVIYEKLSQSMLRDAKSGLLGEYATDSLRCRILNAKNALSREKVLAHLTGNGCFHPCQAGSLFGVISANGTVYPCEIIDKPLGNLRQYSYDLKRLWSSESARESRRWIKTTRCACSYECALSVNILSDFRFYLRQMTGYPK